MHLVVAFSKINPGGQVLHVLVVKSNIAPFGQPIQDFPFQKGAIVGHTIHLP
jgi:hypothetical protein